MENNQKIDFSSFESAIQSLKEALNPLPKNDRERDGAIQRFEYTFELSWKFIRRVLLKLGRAEVSGSPKPLIREAHIEHLIDDVDLWFQFLEARNNTIHTYDSNTADQVFEVAKAFPPFAEALLKRLKKIVK